MLMASLLKKSFFSMVYFVFLWYYYFVIPLSASLFIRALTLWTFLSRGVLFSPLAFRISLSCPLVGPHAPWYVLRWTCNAITRELFFRVKALQLLFLKKRNLTIPCYIQEIIKYHGCNNYIINTYWRLYPVLSYYANCNSACLSSTATLRGRPRFLFKPGSAAWSAPV